MTGLDARPARVGFEWCVVCHRMKTVCCGDLINGFYCCDCCPHPCDDEELPLEDDE